MYQINKITSNPVVDFAAEELKKYLRMMMPRCGEITIAYAPEAKDGFRLGLMQDFGLDVSEAKDLFLDDILHIDADEQGGIIAGSNPRSILQAVYKYLTLNGCRWLFPGIDGEFIPVKGIEPVKYHKMADCRYRGQCNEGAESQQAMMETIDFSPKIGLNVYMMEFDIPRIYYDWYYSHINNAANREPETVTNETILQWKRACEVEIAKRGMQFHDMGHGWTVDAFGIDSTGGWNADMNNPVPDQVRPYLAMTDGQRGLFKGVALNTNFCMSNPEARAVVTKCVCDYAQLNHNVDYLHVWLADGQMNHCECDVCRTKTPSDWYVIWLNEIDEELTARKLDTRIVFCVYSDTAYEPTCESIKNPDRFTMQLGAITRSYTYSVAKDPTVDKLTPFVLNKSGRLDTMEEHIVRTNLWRKFAPCNSFAYEYHFWKHQFYAPGVLSFARRLHEDVFSYRDNGFNGIIEDGSQRAFFPNGLNYYVYASTLFDNSVNFDALVEDYFRHAYGDLWQDALAYLKAIDEHMPQTYVEAKHTIKLQGSQFYKPEMEPKLRAVKGIADQLKEKFAAHRIMPYRVQTIAVRLLMEHADFCCGIADALALKCVGKDAEAKDAYFAFMDEFGKRELGMERYYDHFMATHSLKMIFNTTKSEYDQ
ncbi:MAG: DUF4838 domain-containing protein [Oscillospiraceae bacterium]|nr:DUF4838 domain-containing protein [Oscillospiraceae bacterium]